MKKAEVWCDFSEMWIILGKDPNKTKYNLTFHRILLFPVVALLEKSVYIKNCMFMYKTELGF